MMATLPTRVTRDGYANKDGALSWNWTLSFPYLPHMFNPLLDERIRADVFAVGDGAFYGFDAFFGDKARGIQRVSDADDADGA